MQILTSILFLLFYTPIWAEYGNCVLYEAKYYLKDGSSFKGIIEVKGEGLASYLSEQGSNKYTSDQGMWQLLKEITKRNNYIYIDDGGVKPIEDYGKITFYKSMYELPIKALRKQANRNYTPVYGIVPKNDLVFIDLDEIEQIIFWEARYSKREWLTSEVVIADRDMIQTITNKRYWNALTVTFQNNVLHVQNQLMPGLQMINYNSSINNEELKRLATLKFSSFYLSQNQFQFIVDYYHLEKNNLDHQSWDNLVYSYRRRYWQKLRDWFWKRNVLIIDVWDTC